MTREQIIGNIKKKQSYLCVGLDTDLQKIPSHLKSSSDPVFEFNRQIIDATWPYAVAYKVNTAFYEALGPAGWESLNKTLNYIPADCLRIADAKRGDIGNTSAMYAKAFFEQLHADAITVAPYMGEDSVRPFLQFKNKWVIVLAHTSNPGAADFQLLESKVTDRKLYEEVILKAITWASPDELMFVVGATQADKIKHIRSLAPDYFFLVPGIGAQGGDLGEVSRNALTSQCGLLVNASRSIIYASSGEDFAHAAAREAQKIQQQMAEYLGQII
ncbi:MAG: orotidine-5'-phosphate decarboxylase [Cyclobacteriaceae bacterium]|nr:orotidine-5'-phosphate decarboxylase [Cyclobacteriaceae bacterium]